jgi:hypothetical protein
MRRIDVPRHLTRCVHCVSIIFLHSWLIVYFFPFRIFLFSPQYTRYVEPVDRECVLSHLSRVSVTRIT